MENNKIKISYEDSKETFINPYNFVSQNSKVKGKKYNEYYEKEQLHTGVLECSLITKTSITIPGDKTTKNEHDSYDFNKIDGKYCIPGSSLRGAVRSVFETVTNSCFSTAKPNQIVSIRAKGASKPGLLIIKNGNIELHEADRYIVKVDGYKRFDTDNGRCIRLKKENLEKMGYGCKVFFKECNGNDKQYIKNQHIVVGKYVAELKKEEELQEEESKYYKTGYLYIGEKFGRKHFESIFSDNNRIVKIDEEDVKKVSLPHLLDTIDIYNDPSVNIQYEEPMYEGIKKCVRKIIKGEIKDATLPVWYHDDKSGHIKLSAACIGRIAFKNEMKDILKDKAPCNKLESICPACALFGMANNRTSIGSRIRFTDAYLENKDDDMEEKITLKELGSPKISYMPFYLNKKDNEWSYDSTNNEIKGRKYYWHHKDCNQNYKSNDKGNRNATMTLIKSGNTFTFNVYYDGVTTDQLNILKWCLTFGENETESKLCYKIGHGKPIGLGSSKIVIKSQKERKLNSGYVLEKEYPMSIISTKEIEEYNQNSLTIKELLSIVQTDFIKDINIEYPKIITNNIPCKDNEKAPHKWFSENFKFGSPNNKTNSLPNIESINIKDKALKHKEMKYLEIKNKNFKGKK